MFRIVIYLQLVVLLVVRFVVGDYNTLQYKYETRMPNPGYFQGLTVCQKNVLIN